MDVTPPTDALQLKRRNLLQIFAAALFGSKSALAAAMGDKAGEQSSKHAQSTSKGTTKPSISLEQFMAVSHYLTQVDSLDAKLGQQILSDLERERVWQGDLVRLAAATIQAKRRGISDPSDFVISHNSLKNLMQEILTAWFVGIRMIDQRPKLYTYFDALMFRAVDGVRNTPSICGGALNFWSEPPTT